MIQTKTLIRIFSALLMMTVIAAGKARSESDLAFSSAGQTDAIASSPASQTAYEQAFEKTFDDVVESAAEEGAPVFSLQDEDILSWSESAQGKYLYLSLADIKREELTALTKDNLGKPLRLEIGENYVFIPKITEVLSQSEGLVLQMEDGSRTEFQHSMLDFSKKTDHFATVSMGIGAATGAPANVSGTADRAP